MNLRTSLLVILHQPKGLNPNNDQYIGGDGSGKGCLSLGRIVTVSGSGPIEGQNQSPDSDRGPHFI